MLYRWKVAYVIGALVFLPKAVVANEIVKNVNAPKYSQSVPSSPDRGTVGDTDLLCLIQLREKHGNLFNPKSRDPNEDVAEAMAHLDFRPVGYMRPGDVMALWTECPNKFSDFRIVLGFADAPFDVCMSGYSAAAKLYVTNYNRALTEAAKRKNIDICAERR
jgi:hypothetical protein